MTPETSTAPVALFEWKYAAPLLAPCEAVFLILSSPTDEYEIGMEVIYCEVFFYWSIWAAAWLIGCYLNIPL